MLKFTGPGTPTKAQEDWLARVNAAVTRARLDLAVYGVGAYVVDERGEFRALDHDELMTEISSGQ